MTRPVEMHASDGVAHDLQTALSILRSQLDEGTSPPVDARQRRSTGGLSMVVRSSDRLDSFIVEIPVMEAWPFDPVTRRALSSGDLSTADVARALDAAGDLVACCSPEIDDEARVAIERVRLDATLDLCAYALCRTPAGIEEYRDASGHYCIDRSEDEMGAAISLVLDPGMTGDDGDLAERIPIAVVDLVDSRDPIHLEAVPHEMERGWRILQAERNEGALADSGELNAMDALRRCRALEAAIAPEALAA